MFQFEVPGLSTEPERACSVWHWIVCKWFRMKNLHTMESLG